ncbi:MAG: HAMP domain-containing protein [Gammaproteobacteria bacterium]|nr:HAMP domain-containing protein [Gammaproteobacteria bacterium]
MLLVLLLLGALLSGTVFIVQNKLETKLIGHTEQDLAQGKALLSRLVDERYTMLGSAAVRLRLNWQVIDLFIDPHIQRTMANTVIEDEIMPNYPQVDFLLATTAKGTVIGINQIAEYLPPFLKRAPFFRAALAGQSVKGFIFLSSHLYQVAGEPFYFEEERMGCLFVGKRLDGADLEKIKSLSAVDITLFKQSAIFLSTGLRGMHTEEKVLRKKFESRIGAAFDPANRHGASDQPPKRARFAGEEFLYAVIPESQAAALTYVVSKSFDNEWKFAHELRINLLVSGGVIIAAGLLLSYWLAKSVSRSFTPLLSAIEQVERENYQFRMKVNGGRGEFSALNESFNQMIDGLEEKERVHAAMEKIVSRDVAHEMLHDLIQFGGEARNATIISVDIWGFSQLAEKLEPSELLAFLNNYFTRISYCVDTHGGLVDKYTGDTLTALFGTPLPLEQEAGAAMRTAQDMLEALELFNLETGAPKGHEINIGIGVNTGTLVAGNIGAENRINYSVVGESVKTAARIQGLTKKYGVPVLLSQATHDTLQTEAENNGERVICRELDIIQFDSSSAAMPIFEALPRSCQTPQLDSRLKRFQNARLHLKQRFFHKALTEFQALHADWAADKPTKLLLERCRRYTFDEEAYERENPNGAYAFMRIL